jgi:adenylosuccinate synthase
LARGRSRPNCDKTGGPARRRQQYGATTGRPRRCGWFDGVVARYSRRINGLTGLALTKLDVLDGFPEIKVCTAYKIKGKAIKEMPYGLNEWRDATPVYRTMKGWLKPTAGVRTLSGLPPQARDYVKMLEDLVECPFKIVSTGAGREETIEVGDPYKR